MKIAQRRFAPGFTLVEVALAVGVASFSLIAIFGLLPIGLNTNQASIEQTAAASLSTAVIADLRGAASSTGSSAVSPKFGFTIPAAGGNGSPQTVYIGNDGSATAVNGSLITDGNSASRYRITVGFTPPASGRMATTLHLMVTWPALADAKTPGAQWPTNFSGSYETVMALDRN